MSYRRKILEAKKIDRARKKNTKSENYVSANRQCLNKVAYATEKRALMKIGIIAEEGRKSLRYYQCPFCDLYHLSHKALPWQTFVS